MKKKSDDFLGCLLAPFQLLDAVFQIVDLFMGKKTKKKRNLSRPSYYEGLIRLPEPVPKSTPKKKTISGNQRGSSKHPPIPQTPPPIPQTPPPIPQANAIMGKSGSSCSKQTHER